MTTPSPLDKILARWDGVTRGRYSRKALKAMGHDLDDITWAMRQICLQSHTIFMETIWKLPDGRRVKNSAIHTKMGEFLDEAYERRIPAIVLAPMGLGKTEQGIAWALRLIATDPTERGGIICDVDNHAWQRVDLVRRYIKSDRDFNRLFPEIRVGGGVDSRHAFRLDLNKTAKDESLEGAGVLASGTGTRKEWFIADDCVTAKNAIHEPAQRPRVAVGFEQTWIGRLTPGSWHYVVATLYHADDLWHRLMDKKQGGKPVYAVLRIGVSDDFDHYDVEERWPEETTTYEMPLATEMGWTPDAYRAKHAQLVFDGDASAWYTGYKNSVVDLDNIVRRYVVQPNERYSWIGHYCDPASSDSTESDNMAGWVGAWDNFHKALVILDGYYIRRKGLAERVDTYLDYAERWSPHVNAVEGKHELSFAQRIEERAVERGLTFRSRKVNHTRKKEMRIEGTQPLLKFGKILIDGERFPWLWKEAMLFPRARYDDALDALEGLWALCRSWLRRRGMVGSGFDLDAQWASGPDQKLQQVPVKSIYRTPALDVAQSPNGASPLDRILFPGW